MSIELEDSSGIRNDNTVGSKGAGSKSVGSRLIEAGGKEVSLETPISKKR